jgi:AcrR family transcriptional regulator
MPKIETQTLSQHRDWRRSQLIDAAAAIALESGGEAVTVAAVAARAGLSRTSVYEYFASSADLAADLIID